MSIYDLNITVIVNEEGTVDVFTQICSSLGKRHDGETVIEVWITQHRNILEKREHDSRRRQGIFLPANKILFKCNSRDGQNCISINMGSVDPLVDLIYHVDDLNHQSYQR